MTMPHPQAPQLIDGGNALLNRTPFTMSTGSIETPDGRLGVLTIRTPSTTLTLFGQAEDFRNHATLLSDLAGKLEGNGLVQATPLDLSLLAQLAKRGKGAQ